MNNYEEFIRVANDELGNEKEYEDPFDLNTAYKALKTIV